MKKVESEKAAPYIFNFKGTECLSVTSALVPEPREYISDDAIIKKAISIINGRLRKPEGYATSPELAEQLMRLHIAELEHEVFVVMFLDNRNGLISVDTMFRGTVDGSSVHPREIVKAALNHNACAVVLAHNHPSGISEPSAADKALTKRLQDALRLIDIRVLDHLIIGLETTSFAEKGLL